MKGELLRLRPIAHASPTDTGLHVRGWASSFSLGGGKGLWTLWQRLAGPLTAGVPPEQLTVPEHAPPAVAAAMELIIGQLHEHDLLVRVPASWDADGPPEHIARWLESVAEKPARTWELLCGGTVAVIGSGALAAGAHRALTATGLAVPPVEPGPGLLLVCGGHAVAAGCAADVGFVVAPGTRGDVLADAEAVAHRLNGSVGEPPEALAVLVGSAAAHRLVCAVGELPDPAREVVNMWRDSVPPGPVHQPVFVARMDPLRGEYHPWLSAVRPVLPDGRIVEVLGDAELGPVPAPETDDLPQLPVKLAMSGDAVGFGTTERSARLDAVLRAAHRLAPDTAVVGADRVHALGLALRNAARSLPGTPVDPDTWQTDPTARRWWKAVVLRFALPAEVAVERLGDEVVRAVVRSGGVELSWAIEASAADAVAFAAMAAAGRAQAGGTKVMADRARVGGAVAGRAEVEPVVLSGAFPVEEPNTAGVPWTERAWYWPFGLRDEEEALQGRLRRLLGVTEVKQVALGPVLQAAGLVAFAVPEVGR
ncbi:hypothetical protein ADK67_26550 [Saccharothrix sp. NRRL B-16348]|uniref:hypothetical protein n=1 Tax=Saccharothrix sp. NRRL B-16348 TaxID=1415542 RepID=UPI0006AED1F6|nr:hypothetical protein [Saccharothrix sp. NRRL B-16348]KOX21548.1 hypothetical protein ADK67_26550 [Saccharothrix sp. NRRL B-16348]